MGNQAAKVNRKLENMLQQAYNYLIPLQKQQDDTDQQLEQEQNVDEYMDAIQQSDLLESVIYTSISKDEYISDKRKSDIILNDEPSKQKKVCAQF